MSVSAPVENMCVPWYKEFKHVLRLQVNGRDKTWDETNVIERAFCGAFNRVWIYEKSLF